MRVRIPWSFEKFGETKEPTKLKDGGTDEPIMPKVASPTMKMGLTLSIMEGPPFERLDKDDINSLNNEMSSQ